MLSWFRGNAKETPPAVPSAILGELEVYKPWARSASLPLPDGVAGAFLTITNKGQDDDRMMAGSSPLADHVEIRAIKVVDAGIKMKPLLGGLIIPARNTMTLKPRGYHLLLQGLAAPLAGGATLTLTLTFEKAGAVAVDFAVEEPGLIGEAILHEEHHRG